MAVEPQANVSTVAAPPRRRSAFKLPPVLPLVSKAEGRKRRTERQKS